MNKNATQTPQPLMPYIKNGSQKSVPAVNYLKIIKS